MRRLTFFSMFFILFVFVMCVFSCSKLNACSLLEETNSIILTVNMLITWPLFYNARSATLSLPRVAGNRNRNRERMTPEAVPRVAGNRSRNREGMTPEAVAAITTMKEATPEAVLLHCNLSGLNSGAKIGWQ